MTSNPHDNVKRTIETLSGKGVIAFPQSEEKATAGRPVVEYVFSGSKGKRDSLIVAPPLKTTITMTSIELVEYINSQREKDGAVLAHSDFLKKVPLVLGEEVAGNFSGYYKASNGKQNPLYNFPKREACLMAMSYSYELQAKVFDLPVSAPVFHSDTAPTSLENPMKLVVANTEIDLCNF